MLMRMFKGELLATEWVWFLNKGKFCLFGAIVLKDPNES
jgi:hypothetical protein